MDGGRTFVLAVASIALLSSCKHAYFVKPGSSELDFAQDRDACEREATVNHEPPDDRAEKLGVNLAKFRDCMLARGYAESFISAFDPVPSSAHPSPFDR